MNKGLFHPLLFFNISSNFSFTTPPFLYEIECLLFMNFISCTIIHFEAPNKSHNRSDNFVFYLQLLTHSSKYGVLYRLDHYQGRQMYNQKYFIAAMSRLARNIVLQSTGSHGRVKTVLPNGLFSQTQAQIRTFPKVVWIYTYTLKSRFGVTWSKVCFLSMHSTVKWMFHKGANFQRSSVNV